MLAPHSFLYLFLLLWVGVVAAYEPLYEYSGATFFDGWDYYGYWDNLTLGNVTYVDAATAASQQLTYVNDAGNAIIRVDNFTTVENGDLRNSVRLTSQAFYDYGSLWIINLAHIPYGCSVWPAFWSKGPHWPYDGEIDIIEAINLMPDNQMALHTTEGCVHNVTEGQAGYSIDNDCGAAPGCTVGISAPNSYESGFAAAGGGVYATQFDVSGIYIWFWSRPDVPAVIANATSNSSMDTTTWGTPTASYPVNAYCNLTQYFTAQQLIFDITLCGDWAGVPSIYDGDCYAAGPTHDCYLDNVVGNGSNYDEAYFEVSYVRTYTTGLATVSVTSSASTATSTTSPKTETSGALASRVGLTEVLQASVLLTALLAPLITLWWL